VKQTLFQDLLRPGTVGCAAGKGKAKGAANMNDCFEALSWLNQPDSETYLDEESRQLIKRARQIGQPDHQVSRITERLRNAARLSEESRQKGEILLYCAAIESGRGRYPRSALDANQAVISYEKDEHRRAVALWVLGNAQWKMLRNYEAYASWEEARKTFHTRRKNFEPLPKSSWYKKTIRQMDVKFAGHPEEILNWLNCFEESSLSVPCQQVVKSVEKKIRTQTYQNINHLMEDFQTAKKLSREIYERAEIYLRFGLAIYQLGNLYSAIEWLSTAVQKFDSGIGTYHKQVVARCIVGAVEWMYEPTHNHAIVDWTRSVEEFEDLRVCASRDNNQTKREWYTQHRAILHTALSDRLRLPPARDRNQGQFQSPPHGTPPGVPNMYQYLMFLAEGDSELAKRLIEIQRQRFPHDHPNRLIARAIDYLLSDRI
jgi:tetratricopeptide (TPR) repeat protein